MLVFSFNDVYTVCMLKRVNITLAPQHIEALDLYSKQIGKNRSEVIRDWIVEKLSIDTIKVSVLTEEPTGVITDALPTPQR